MIFDRTKYSKCAGCPLNGEARVWGDGPAKPVVMFVGEAPGEDESKQRKPFVGSAGKWLNAALGSAGILRHRCHITNVIACRPPRNNISSWEAERAISCCKPGLAAEIEAITKYAKVVVPLGGTAKSAFGIKESITKCRGSVYPHDGYVAVPTFHPSYIMRGMSKEEPTWIADLEKAKEIAKNGYNPPREHFILYPDLHEALDVLHDLVLAGKPVAVDIETTSLDPDYSEILCIGLASDGETAISIPFVWKDRRHYWKFEEYQKVRQALQELFRTTPTVFQNALFDVAHLERHGYEVSNVQHDVLLAHHAVHPELPHNLGYIVSIYGKTPYWKGEILGRDWKLDYLDDDFFIYNLRDAVVLHQVLEPLLEDLRDAGTESTYYDYSIPLVKPLLQMTTKGLPLSKKKLTSWTASLKRKITKLEKELRELGNLPEAFNLNSDVDLRWLLYGEAGTKFEKAISDLASYDDPGSRKKKDSKRYRELKALVGILEEVQPLYRPKHHIKKTESHMLSVDEEAINNILIAANSRKKSISSIKRRTQKHEKEVAEVEKLIEFLSKLLQHREYAKLISTYTKFRSGKDGRVHSKYNIHGTATGRLSSRDPNGQNIPAEAKKIFVAPEGRVILSGDYSNIELRVLAIISNDKPLQQTFADGINVHDANTRDLFDIDESHPMWYAARRAAKTYIFGRNYGGGLRGIFERVSKQVPELGLVYEQFCTIDRAYRKKHPAYAQWAKITAETVLATRRLANAFGRVRIFLGTTAQIQREGLNYGIQSTAADIVNRATIRVYEDLRKKYPDSFLIGQVHDSLMVECPKKDVKAVAKLMRKHMEASYVINGVETSFPVDFEAGQSWGEMDAISLA